MDEKNIIEIRDLLVDTPHKCYNDPPKIRRVFRKFIKKRGWSVFINKVDVNINCPRMYPIKS